MELEKTIRNKLAEVLKIENPEEISLEKDLKEYGMDSLNAIELVVALEMEFGIEFAEDDLLVDNLCTVQKLILVVRKYQESLK
ncbi:MAG: acyl carrier protein [Eubacterium sp.]|jgi:D-alanine--poly(phosphoribitol) ligase subunit 2|nr:acyl carrier protein [Eubacterium sp.]